MMDYIKRLRGDNELMDLMCVVSDVEILPEYKKPQDEKGQLTYSISGKTFAREKNGSEYIWLEDGSVGFWGSEGQGGRIADNLQDFFELIINCPYWKDCIYEAVYQDIEELREFAKEIYEENEEQDEEQDQQQLADFLELTKSNDVTRVLIKFYHSAKREPRLILTYKEEDGSTCSRGSMFDCLSR